MAIFNSSIKDKDNHSVTSPKKIWLFYFFVLLVVGTGLVFFFFNKNGNSNRFSLLSGSGDYEENLEPTIPVAGLAQDVDDPDVSQEEFMAEDFDLGPDENQEKMAKYQIVNLADKIIKLKSENGEEKELTFGGNAELYLVRSFHQQGTDNVLRMGWENALASGLQEDAWVKVSQDDQGSIYKIYFLSEE